MNRFQRHYQLFKRKFQKNKNPLWILINLTNECPYRCSYCNIPTENAIVMSTETIYKLVDSCIKVGIKFITLTGGEVLIRNDIAAIIDYIKTKNVDVRLSTEGVSDREKMTVLKKIDLVNISFDGPEEVHDRQRFSGSFKNVLHNIAFFKKEKIPFRAICVLTKNNVNHIDYIADFARDNKFDVFFQPLSNTYFYRDNIPDGLSLDQKEIAKTALLLREMKMKNKYIANSAMMLEYLCDRNNCFYRCHAKTFFIYAHWDGKIYHCWVNPTNPLGDITEEELEDILHKEFHYSYTYCDCSSYSCLEKNYLVDLPPLLYCKSKYL